MLEVQTQEEVVRVEDMSDEEVRAQALRWINDIRGEYGLTKIDVLPSATPGDSGDCVLARALQDVGDRSCLFESKGRCVPITAPEEVERNAKAAGAPVAEMRFPRDGEMRTLYPPPAVASFMTRFDRGHYPDLGVPTPSLIAFTCTIG